MLINCIIRIFQIHQRPKCIFHILLILFTHLPYSKHLIYAPSTLPTLTLLLLYCTFKPLLFISTLPYSWQTTLFKVILLELLHSYLLPFPIYMGTIHAPRQYIGIAFISYLAFNTTISPTSLALPYHISLHTPMEIHTDLEPYPISFHSLPPLLLYRYYPFIQFSQHLHSPIANYIYIRFPAFFHIQYHERCK